MNKIIILTQLTLISLLCLLVIYCCVMMLWENWRVNKYLKKCKENPYRGRSGTTLPDDFEGAVYYNKVYGSDGEIILAKESSK